MATTDRPRIWLLQDGEPLPSDDNPRLMRTGTLAEKLVDAGFDVTWWTSRFHHNLKRYRQASGTVTLGPHYRLRLLDGPPYRTNLSLARIRHYRRLAAHFTADADAFPPADLVLGSYPSPELCDAGLAYARRRSIPFVVDIRDPWPDIFEAYLPAGTRWLIRPILWHYRRRFRRIARGATAIVAVARSQLDWGLAYARREERPSDRVIYIGFSAEEESRAAPPAGFSTDTPLRCALISSCGRSYDGSLVVEAARRLHEAGERRVEFLIIGDGEMRPTWMRQADGLPNVVFTGFANRKELQRHTARTHIGLIAMRGGITRFWLGNKIFEYLASSLALINNVPGEAAALVAEHRLGASIPPGDAAALAGAVRDAVDHPKRVAEWMQNAQRVFETQFERRRTDEDYVNHLAGLLLRRVCIRTGKPRLPLPNPAVVAPDHGTPPHSGEPA